MHSAEPVFKAKSPAAHAVHLADTLVEDDPAAHGEQLAAPAAEYWPAAQSAHERLDPAPT